MTTTERHQADHGQEQAQVEPPARVRARSSSLSPLASERFSSRTAASNRAPRSSKFRNMSKLAQPGERRTTAARCRARTGPSCTASSSVFARIGWHLRARRVRASTSPRRRTRPVPTALAGPVARSRRSPRPCPRPPAISVIGAFEGLQRAAHGVDVGRLRSRSRSARPSISARPEPSRCGSPRNSRRVFAIARAGTPSGHARPRRPRRGSRCCAVPGGAPLRASSRVPFAPADAGTGSRRPNSHTPSAVGSANPNQSGFERIG